MLNRFKSAIINAVNNLDQSTSGVVNNQSDYHNSLFKGSSRSSHHEDGPPTKFRYSRPVFLQFSSDDEILVSADHVIRPIIVPRDITKLPYNSGYAETINAGKSIRNEDQAAVHRGLLRAIISPDNIAEKVADMMPTIPSYPQQHPVNRNKFVNDTEKNNEKPKPTNQNDNKILNGSADKNVTNCSTDKSVSNGSGSHPNNIPIDINSPTTPLNDILSPSTPLPIELTNMNDIVDDTDSPYVTPKCSPDRERISQQSLPWVYFGVFDGHAGSGVAVAASNTLHKIIENKLQAIADLLISFGLSNNTNNTNTHNTHNTNNTNNTNTHNTHNTNNTNTHNTSDSHRSNYLNGSMVINQENFLPHDNIALLFNPAPDKLVTVDSLIIGALEAAFWEMDNLIASDKQIYKMSGGCTACIALFILGKLYIANAGDSRAIIYSNNKVIPMSFDFTPESEKERIKYLGLLRPEYLGNDFTHLEFVRRPARRDLGKKLLYKDAFMTGWAYKTITIEDLKFPLIYGEGKRSRVLATIGVTRGFGDHELKAQNSDVDIKPFLTAQPEVRVFDIENNETITDSDVLILGTDGLWDITTNEQAAEIVKKSLDHFPANDAQRFKYRYTSAAQDLVMHSRGKAKEKGKGWKTVDNKAATIDDISVFVIPLQPYKDEYSKWKSATNIIKNQGER